MSRSNCVQCSHGGKVGQFDWISQGTGWRAQFGRILEGAVWSEAPYIVDQITHQAVLTAQCVLPWRQRCKGCLFLGHNRSRYIRQLRGCFMVPYLKCVVPSYIISGWVSTLYMFQYRWWLILFGTIYYKEGTTKHLRSWYIISNKPNIPTIFLSPFRVVFQRPQWLRFSLKGQMSHFLM